MKALWQDFGDDYFLSCRSYEIAWHAGLLTGADDPGEKAFVDVQEQAWLSGTAVLIYAPQEQFTFAIATAVIDEFGLSLTDARIIPLENDCSLSIYTIHEQDGQPITEESRRAKIRQRLTTAVRGDEDSKSMVTRKAPRQVRMFNTPTTVQFARDDMRSRTVMDIVAGDRPGLAAQIGRVLRKENVFIRMAKLVTVGERAEDVFFITDDTGKPLSQELEESLRAALLRTIDSSDSD